MKRSSVKGRARNVKIKELGRLSAETRTKIVHNSSRLQAVRELQNYAIDAVAKAPAKGYWKPLAPSIGERFLFGN